MLWVNLAANSEQNPHYHSSRCQSVCFNIAQQYKNFHIFTLSSTIPLKLAELAVINLYWFACKINQSKSAHYLQRNYKFMIAGAISMLYMLWNDTDCAGYAVNRVFIQNSQHWQGLPTRQIIPIGRRVPVQSFPNWTGGRADVTGWIYYIFYPHNG